MSLQALLTKAQSRNMEAMDDCFYAMSDLNLVPSKKRELYQLYLSVVDLASSVVPTMKKTLTPSQRCGADWIVCSNEKKEGPWEHELVGALCNTPAVTVFDLRVMYGFIEMINVRYDVEKLTKEKGVVWEECKEKLKEKWMSLESQTL